MKERIDQGSPSVQDLIAEIRKLLGDCMVIDGPTILIDDALDRLEAALRPPVAPLDETTLRLVQAVRAYLDYLHGPDSLGTDEFQTLKGRIVTIACQHAALTPPVPLQGSEDARPVCTCRHDSGMSTDCAVHYPSVAEDARHGGQPQGWQPMATAPKVHPLNGGDCLLLAWVAPGIGEWIFVVGQWRDGWWSGADKAFPTHWMPLPPAPAGA